MATVRNKEQRKKDYRQEIIVSSVLVIVLIIAFIIWHHRTAATKVPIKPDPAFAAYVSGYTGGTISRKHSILIRLAVAPKKKVQAGDPFPSNLLSFRPSIKGKAFWKDPRTIEFDPSKPLQSGSIYTATLQLNKVVSVANKKFNRFRFGFQVIPQSFAVTGIHLIAKADSGLNQYTLTGKIITADYAGDSDVAHVLKAKFEGENRPVSWKTISSTEHAFFIKKLTRKNEPGEVKLSWDGDPIDVDLTGKKSVVIPAKGVFKLTKVDVEEGKQQAIHLYFSDPLDQTQKFLGLVQVDSQTSFDFSAQDNELTLFNGKLTPGDKTLSIFQGIQNIAGKAIPRDTAFSITIESPKPAIRFVHSGNLLPSTQGMILPFEAVGLKSVLLRVIQIKQDRIGQFLQVNNLDGSSQLNRVGRPILQKVIRLDNMGVKDPDHWHRYTLELSKLIQPAQGAIYQVALAFTPKDVTNYCGLKSSNGGLTKVSNSREKIDENGFNGGGSYYYDNFGEYYGDNYDWSKRNDPCNAAYYSGGKNVIKQNILATNIGLIAKRGTDNKLQVIATNLMTAKPMPGVAIHVYNYQLQQIAETNTNHDGVANINLSQKAFLIEAKQQDQWSYLKVNNGNALSVSQFNVSGERIQHGIKGFLYGDRGVWRPGDSLYLTFMLDDKAHPLPAADPVTFTFTNPRGVVVHKTIKTASVKGLYSFRTATLPTAPTGNWTATVAVGGATFSKNIRIETVKPNRLKIDLNFPGEKLTPDHQTGTLHARWLSGATASNLQAQYDMILSAVPTHIKGYKSYQFDDPNSSFLTDERTVFKGRLDANGNATINVGIQLKPHAPATLNAYFTGKIFEPGGNFSVNYQSAKFYPYKTYIGIQPPKGSGYGNMLDLNKNYRVNIVSVTADGAPVDQDSLEVSVYRTKWRWWWQADNDDDADYVNSRYYRRVFTTTCSTHNGKGSFPLKIKAPNWGRYYIHVENPKNGYTTGAFVYFEYPYGESSNTAGMPGGATRLTFTTDKQVYKTGETMKVFIPGSGVGKILISVENGTGVLKTYWMDEKKGTNIFSIPVTKDMTPNVYLDVSEMQPHGQTVNDLPIRQYGIIGVKVEDPQTYLHPVIEMPKEIHPNRKVTIHVKEKSGKPMAYTIAVVDEGLLDLTNFKTPKPHNAFYAKEALGVKTWDVFDRVIGAYGAHLERLLSIGGDGAIEPKKPKKNNVRFKPVVEFFGPYFLRKGQTGTVSFTMPNYVGEVRTMVVAGYQGAYGSAEQSTPVKQPLMILATLPRVTGPGEDIMLPVNVFAMKPNIKNVSVHVTGDKYFSIVGNATKSVHFDHPGNTMVMFKIHVAKTEGDGHIEVSASGNGFTATSETNLTVRNPNPPQTKVLTKVLQAGETWTPDVTFFGMKGTNSANLEVAGISPLNIGKRLSYLINYPFGCLEQRVSSAFPQLYLDDLLSLSDKQKEKITKHISKIIAQIPQFQHTSGGFTYWPGSNYPDDWVTSYAGNFLIEAQKKGYTIVPGLLNKWARYQTGRSDSWKPQNNNHWDDLTQAYRLYTLALAGKPDWSAMNRMNGLQHLSLQSRWCLANAYTLAGRKDVAEKLVEGVTTDIAPYRQMAFTYGSSLRDKAMILQTLVNMGKASKGFSLADKITKKLNSDSWLSTQETSFSLMALSKYYSREKGATTVKYSYQENGGSAQNIHTDKSISQQTLHLNESHPTLKITNRSDGVLYAHVFVKGTPVAGNELAEAHNLQMIVRYKDMKGHPVNPAKLAQGTDFMVEVTVKNPGLKGDYKNMALTQIFPSGWEIRNTRFEGTSNYFQASVPTYQNIRDDRVYTYFDLPAGKQKTFRILLNASYAGHFYLPGIKCSAMYDQSINATKPGEWVTVKATK